MVLTFAWIYPRLSISNNSKGRELTRMPLLVVRRGLAQD